MWTAETVLVCALALLPRSPGSFPPIVLVDTRPRYASAAAEAWVLSGDRRIHLLTTSRAFVQAMRSLDRCGELLALKKIASVVIHEEWHVRHGTAEDGAYAAQLTALTAMHAGPGTPLYSEVSRAGRAVASVSSSRSRRSDGPRPRASSSAASSRRAP